jgi:hypothetical protein
MMIGKIISYGLVGVLAVGLVGGSAYILARPDGESAQTQSNRSAQPGDLQGYGTKGLNGNADSAGAGGHGGVQNRQDKTAAMDGQGNGRRVYASGSSSSPSAGEIQGAVALLEEEKLARDVYLSLYQQWGFAAFQNIAGGEQTHMDALTAALERAGVSDPMAGYGSGEFPTPSVRDLYLQFTARGSESLAEALKAAAAIEEIDILDIEGLQAQTANPALRSVYDNLRRGSIQHLSAYSAAYEGETGETYLPQHLSREAFDALMSLETNGPRGGGPQAGRMGSRDFRG